MNCPPDEFQRFSAGIVSEACEIEGYLSPDEMRFLSLIAAVPRASGEVLEIGSFKGRSTFILASCARFAGQEKIHAVDPLIAPAETDPDLGTEDSSERDFFANLELRGVAEFVAFHKELSHELAEHWDSPIRLLWIDGDHTYEGTKRDLDCFRPFLSDGAIVAIHDALHEFEGGIRVFAEDILLSRSFGACGFVGSIAWSQYRSDSLQTRHFIGEKLALYKKASRLIPYVAFGRRLEGFEKKKYKLVRSRVPHGAVDPEEWLALTANPGAA
ncbi:MAG: class I SAM-dependent methyltransferase [Aridibacter famidurans]|nr:class I SAM-dependent methyltransferase [Aridibacter famidurans]